MKKFLAILLTLLMLCSVVALPASAVTNEHKKMPIIFIAGSSVDLVDGDQNPISTGFDVLTDDDEGDGYTKEQIIETVMNIVMPFVLEGLPMDKWDNYGKALYEELAPIFEEGQLDGNGNPKFGTGVAKAEVEKWDKNALKDHGKDNWFGMRDYDFRYDWRLSPYDHVDRLHNYIKTIIKTTGCKQVALVGRCLGGNVITAYLDEYGDEKLVGKVVYDEVMSNGSVVINDIFSGKIQFNDKLIQAYVLESEHFGKSDIGIDLIGVNDLLLEIVERTLDLLTQTGVADTLYGGVAALYEKLYEAFMPAMLQATGIGTWVSYWSSISDADFDTALNLLFGKEGTEGREANAGLIAKINEVRTRIVKPREIVGDANLYKRFTDEYGVEIAVIAGYGLVNPPITESSDANGDCTVDTKCSSFGATVAGVFDKLPQDYIDAQVAAGKGKYISIDGKVDASTCMFPETTWFIKNKHHDTYAQVVRLAEYFTQYTNVNADSNSKNISRFLVVDPNNFENAVNMTEENCADGPWLTVVEQEPTKETALAALIRFFTTIFKAITAWLNGLFSF
ncbi:MAG: hypothetical protein UHM85_02910 [Acutalibacteraceae bacterium]|nr:hypothetical protein [Acutalibacteraceae bacterium]